MVLGGFNGAFLPLKPPQIFMWNVLWRNGVRFFRPFPQSVPFFLSMLSVRELQPSDIPLIANYWLNADPEFLKGMGVALERMPSREQWLTMLPEQLGQSYADKKSYAIIWEIEGVPVGHSNVNKIVFGQEAYMHLHLWQSDIRQKGMGEQLIRMTLPFFFKNMQLKRLLCEPYAHNPAPNKALEKVGFQFVEKIVTTPGWLNFEQEVNLWELTLERFERL